MAGPDDGDALLTGPGFDKAAQGAAQLDVPPGLRKWRGEDVCVDGHDGQVRLRTGRDDGAGNTVVDAQFVAEGEVETVIKPGTQQLCRRGMRMPSARAPPGARGIYIQGSGKEGAGKSLVGH